MTQLAECTGLAIEVGGNAYEVAPMARTPESVRAAELAGELVIAQQVSLDGQPLARPAPAKWKASMSPEAWDAYIQDLRKDRESDEPLPMVTMPPRIGMVRSLGETASYFALNRFDSTTTSIIPFHVVNATSLNPASQFQLFTVR